MSNVIKYLKAFNRKERFILLTKALGNDTFRLDADFATELGRHLNIKIACDAFVAMDYHLNWLQMALYLTANPKKADPRSLIPQDKLFEDNQQDVDLIIAFEDSSTTHLVMIEAKADTSWDNSQLKRKNDRLKVIFRKGGHGTDFVTPYFVLMSPKESENIKCDEWLDFMKQGNKPIWMELRLQKGLLSTTRSDADCKQGKEGGFLRIDRVS